MKTSDLYQTVTDQIIKDLEAGVPSWIKPWKTGNTGGILPHNAVTNRHYSGINVPILWYQADKHGYPSHSWLTYKQAQAANAQVRKGERSTVVVFTKRIQIRDDGGEIEKQIAMLRTFNVFNVAQVDGLPQTVAPASPDAPDTAARAFIEATGAAIKYGGDRAFYTPQGDFIGMPPAPAFETLAHHDATALHELTHWTGATHRLDRDLGGRFGSHRYAAEELVAELGAAFLCASLGIEGRLRHAEYINNWLQLLKADNRAVFTAAAKAQQAADYLRSFSIPVAEAA